MMSLSLSRPSVRADFEQAVGAMIRCEEGDVRGTHSDRDSLQQGEPPNFRFYNGDPSVQDFAHYEKAQFLR